MQFKCDVIEVSGPGIPVLRESRRHDPATDRVGCGLCECRHRAHRRDTGAGNACGVVGVNDRSAAPSLLLWAAGVGSKPWDGNGEPRHGNGRRRVIPNIPWDGMGGHA